MKKHNLTEKDNYGQTMADYIAMYTANIDRGYDLEYFQDDLKDMKRIGLSCYSWQKVEALKQVIKNLKASVNFEIKEYRLSPPFNSDRVYMAIFRNGQKTNFWVEKGSENEGQIAKYLILLQSGIIDYKADDQCSFCRWQPSKVEVYNFENIPVEIRQKIDSYHNKLFSISGSHTAGREQEYIARANEKHQTQYSKILNRDLSGIADTCCVIVYPYGVDYYAI